jgi:hypothetical protein
MNARTGGEVTNAESKNLSGLKLSCQLFGEQQMLEGTAPPGAVPDWFVGQSRGLLEIR